MQEDVKLKESDPVETMLCETGYANSCYAAYLVCFDQSTLWANNTPNPHKAQLAFFTETIADVKLD